MGEDVATRTTHTPLNDGEKRKIGRSKEEDNRRSSLYDPFVTWLRPPHRKRQSEICVHNPTTYTVQYRERESGRGREGQGQGQGEGFELRIDRDRWSWCPGYPRKKTLNCGEWVRGDSCERGDLRKPTYVGLCNVRADASSAASLVNTPTWAGGDSTAISGCRCIDMSWAISFRHLSLIVRQRRF